MSSGRVPPSYAGREFVGRFDEEAAGERGVGVEGYAELAQEGEEGCLGVAADGVVVALVNCGKDVAVGGAVVVDGLDVGGEEAGDAKVLNFPSRQSFWIASRVSEISVAGSGEWR